MGCSVFAVVPVPRRTPLRVERGRGAPAQGLAEKFVSDSLFLPPLPSPFLPLPLTAAAPICLRSHSGTWAALVMAPSVLEAGAVPLPPPKLLLGVFEGRLVTMEGDQCGCLARGPI